ncbi:uncharacterized protein [Glycine max]|uniref:uncharacterized protein isoform X4 n=1 Tax=Glycine max TaxID=3847 RepID=UPI001B357010|nr:uncharacterized protein LOC100818832 isoform X4 [Glycine max]
MLLAAYPWTTATHLGLKTDAVFSASENRHLKKRIKRLKDMVEPDKNCETRVEDVAWLCSLSESEIDMLISLKLLIIQRAKMMGCKELASKFNLKMIRAIGMITCFDGPSEGRDKRFITYPQYG